MKKFGKKTLSLALAFVMVLSLCTFVSFAAGDVELKIGEEQTLVANTERTVTWSSSAETVVSVDQNGKIKGLKEGSATITASAPAIEADPEHDIEAQEAFEETWNVTVPAPVVTEYKANPTKYTVGYGTSLRAVSASLLKDVTVTAVYDNGTEQTVTVDSWNSSDYNEKTLGDYTFTAIITDAASGVNLPSVTVTVGKVDASKSTFDLGTVYVPVGTKEADAVKSLPDTIRIAGADVKVSDLYKAWECTTTYSDKAGKVNRYEAQPDDKAEAAAYYSGLQTVKAAIIVVDPDNQNVEKSCSDTDGMNLSSIVNELNNLMKDLYNVSITAISLDDIGADGGELYEDEDLDRLVKEDEYTAAEVSDMYFVPDGSGDDFEIEYTAVGKNTKTDRMSGTITITSDSFIVMEITLTNQETYDFTIDEINQALEDLETKTDTDFELVSLNGITVSPKNYGTVYESYDADAKSNKAASGTYYAEPSKRQTSVEELTFVPNEKLTETVTANVEMNATVSYNSKSGSKTTEKEAKVDLILRVTIVDEADITLYVKNEDYVVFDPELFNDFLQDNKASKTVDVALAYVTFDGLPNSNKLGRIYDDYEGNIKNTNQKYISNPDGKEYYYDDPKNGDYALDTLTYVTGTAKDHTIRVEFTIHYTRSSSKTVRSDLTGTMDIVVGAKQTSGGSKVTEMYNSGTFRDSDVYKFAGNTFGSDVSYVVFTSEPTGGKLVYNFGKAGMTDVKLNTNYYTSGTGNLLSNVTFVPTYGNALRATIDCKAVTAKNKTTNYRITLTITRSTASRYFNDVTASSFSTYADSIDLLRNMGITTGTTATTFEPAKTLTRGEWITMLYRAAGSPSVSGTNKFTDVPNWCKDAVQWAVANGITNGTSATTFSPAQVLTRQEIAQFLYNWVVKMNGTKVTNNANLNNYTDGSTVAAWAQDAVKWALGNGYFDTVSGKINPTGNSNRAEAADSLHRLLAK